MSSFKPGDEVTVENAHNRLTGTVTLVSANQKSLAVTFDGEQVAIQDGRGGLYITRALPLLQDADAFSDLWGNSWTVTPHMTRYI